MFLFLKSYCKVKHLIFLGLMLLPLSGITQITDSAAIRQVDSILMEVRALRSKRDYDKAMEVNAVAEILALEKLGPESVAYANCCYQHSRILNNKGDLEEAEKWHLLTKDIQRKALGEKHPDYAWTLNYLADLYQRMGNYEKAAQYFREALISGEKAFGKENSNYAIILDNQAYLCGAMGDLEKAEELSLKAHIIFEKTVGTESASYAINSNMLYNWYLGMARYDKAEEFCYKTLHAWEKVKGKESPEYARSLDNLAILNYSLGNYAKAEQHYWESYAILEKIRGQEDHGFILCSNNLTIFLMLLGNYEKAEQLLLKVRDIQEQEKGKESLEYSESQRWLGWLYHTKGNYEKAESYYAEAIAIREKILGKGNSENEEFLTGLASLYQDMGNYEKAESLFLKLKTNWDKNDNKKHNHYVVYLNTLANFYHVSGNYEKAEQLYLEASQLREELWGIGLDPGYAGSLMNMADLYKDMGQYEKAAYLFEELSNLQQSLISRATRHMSQLELINYLNTFSNNLDHMLSFVQIASENGNLFHPACYDNILFYKGFLLNTSNRIKWLALSDPNTREKFNMLNSYERRLAAEYAKPISDRKNVAELIASSNDLEKQLAITIGHDAITMLQVRWQEVQQKLQVGEAAVEFIHYQYYGKKQSDSIMYAALILLPDDAAPQFIPLFEEMEISSILKGAKGSNFHKINALYAGQTKNPEHKTVYDLIWKPMEEKLKGVKTIYCSSSGLLHRINLGALSIDEELTLADRHQIVLLNSTRQLVTRTTTENEGLDGYIVGGVRYDIDSTAIASANALYATRGMTLLNDNQFQDELPLQMDSTSRGGRWNYLPQTASEAVDIHQVFLSSGISTQLDTGYLATEESFRSLGTSDPSPRVLHVATHGFFFSDPKESVGYRSSVMFEEPVFKISEHPMIRSGLIMAGAQHAWSTGKSQDNREDGILTAYEISQMNLSNTELVVLSACETGLGDIEGNEGVYGLQRAFKIAGAKYLIMSLWKVNDQSTRDLMTEFYRQWLVEKLSIPDAFRHAQRIMKLKYPDAPYLWAGFLLVE